MTARSRAGFVLLTAVLAAAALWMAAKLGTPRGAPGRPAGAPGRPAFTDVTRQAGFTHVHHKPVLDHQLDPIMSWVGSVGAAAAAGDFDNDGWVDLYVTDSDKGQLNHLYRNLGNGTFADVAVPAGVARVNDDTGTSMDCVWGDYDNDGWLDLYVVKWGRDQLFRNNRDGTFTDVTAHAFVDKGGRPGTPWANGCAAIWLDYDGDGRLDLYVGNYFAPHDLWHLKTTHIMHDSFERSRNAGRNCLYRNNGDGTFTEVGRKLHLDDPGWTLSLGHADINNDGWPDIYVANDFGPDQIFLNRGDGTFRNISEQAIGKDTRKGMNVEFGDFDNDGWLDVYVTNITTAEYLREGNMMWHNDASDSSGTPIFMDVAGDAQTGDGGWGWGAKFFDFDNDGDLDLVSANGFITAGAGSYWYDLASWTVTGEDVTDARNWPPIGDRSFSGHEPTRLWRNDGGLRFTEIAHQAGVDDRRDGRGVVVFDYDNDGDLDLYIANQGAAPVFYRNDVGRGRHWTGLKLTGRPASGSNRDAIGARVTVVTPSGRQIRELDGGNSFCGQSDRRVFFGLGDEAKVETLEIRWPSRRVQVLHDLPADRVVALEEPAALPEVTSLIPRTHGNLARHPVARSAEPAPASPASVAELSGLEAQVLGRPDDLSLASRYRARCARLSAQQRATVFFERLLAEKPGVREVRLQLAASYVDQIPLCGGMAAIVCKGTLARKALQHMDRLIHDDPNWWPAVYSRAMNHLHWPRALRHSDKAAADFRRCLELQRRAGRPNGRPYFVRAYVGLGDALAKDGDFEGGRAAWREGLSVFPDDAGLRERLASKSAADARAYVERVRNLDEPIDTDFSFLAVP